MPSRPKPSSEPSAGSGTVPTSKRSTISEIVASPGKGSVAEAEREDEQVLDRIAAVLLEVLGDARERAEADRGPVIGKRSAIGTTS
jgi:hypothetical protein